MKKLLRILYLIILCTEASAVLPTGAVDVKCLDGSCQYTLLSSQASFGIWPEMTPARNDPMKPMIPPENDPLLCLGSTASDTHISDDGQKFVLVVPRGQCSFEQKAITAQKLGASGLIIYGTLASRYGFNSTTDELIYPQEYNDYDCNMAQAEIPISSLSIEKQYNQLHNDPILSGSASQGNLCALQNPTFETKCPSQRCLLTGNITSDGNYMKSCCAWDLFIWLYNDDSINDKEINLSIPAFYITMVESDMLLQDMKTQQIQLVMYRRYYPKYNLASFMIWGLGVFVAALASWMSASEYRNFKSSSSSSDSEALEVAARGHGYHRVGSSSNSNPSSSSFNEESVELEASHACGFIVFSSMGLLVLFFFKIYNVVKVMYAFGCSGALSQVIIYPLLIQVTKKLNVQDRIACTASFLDIGVVTVSQLIASFVSYGVGAVWLYMALTFIHPDENTFFWVMQDVFGACMCIIFLSTMRLNSIKVASTLLLAAFVYDIFFVFVTPYLTKGGESIMIDVATSGGPPKADPSWCEKYPRDRDCRGGDPLPMLFTIPRLFDFTGGSSMLGLGDIVLPGLLISFAARYDEAKRFIGKSNRGGSDGSGVVNQTCSTKSKGYFPYLVIAYAIGLAMANIAVYAMNMGQPALLYLVPCCLGTMIYLAKKRGEDLWNTPKVITACDEILYGIEDTDGNNQDENDDRNDDTPGLRSIT
jgi:signal peptide peptidase-like 2B